MPPAIIAIDGPAGSGKTVVGKRVADALGYLYVDTGAFYRAITLQAQREGVQPADGQALADLTRRTSIVVDRPKEGDRRTYTVLLNGTDVTDELSTPDVAGAVSIVAAHPEVRTELLPIQRRAVAEGRVVIAGRDIGTVIAPEAGLKLFLGAPFSVRVSRRVEQLEKQGRNPNPPAIAAEMAARDRIDQTRAVAPLVPAPDAVILDTSTMTIDEEVARILELAGAG